MRKLFKSLREWIDSHFGDFSYYYAIVENTRYHEIISEYTNSYSVVKVKSGGRSELITEGFINVDQAERYATELIKHDKNYRNERSEVIKKFNFE